MLCSVVGVRLLLCVSWWLVEVYSRLSVKMVLWWVLMFFVVVSMCVLVVRFRCCSLVKLVFCVFVVVMVGK